MPDTLLDVAKRVNRRVGLPVDITEFKEPDGSKDVVQYINQAYFSILDDVYPSSPYIKASDISITTVQGTAEYTLQASEELFNVLPWSAVSQNSDGEKKNLGRATEEYLLTTYPDDYRVTQGDPSLVYFSGTDKVSFHPVPDGVYTITFLMKSGYTELVNPTDTFSVPDKWLHYIELQANYLWHSMRGLGDADELESHAMRERSKIIGTQFAWAKPSLSADGWV